MITSGKEIVKKHVKKKNYVSKESKLMDTRRKLKKECKGKSIEYVKIN